MRFDVLCGRSVGGLSRVEDCQKSFKNKLLQASQGLGVRVNLPLSLGHARVEDCHNSLKNKLLQASLTQKDARRSKQEVWLRIGPVGGSEFDWFCSSCSCQSFTGLQLCTLLAKNEHGPCANTLSAAGSLHFSSSPLLVLWEVLHGLEPESSSSLAQEP